MKNLAFKTLLLIFSISFSQALLSQTHAWEDYNTLNTNMPNYRNGTLGNDVAYDNYGLHMAVICQGQNPCFNTLNYYHFDNSGKKLDSNRAIESDILGVCIGSNNGKVYIVAFKNGVFKIYQRINGVSELQFKLSYDPPNYGSTSSNDHFVNMSMAFINEKVYLVWDRVGYTTGSFSYGGAVGFAMYDPIENVMISYLPLNHFGFLEFGRPLLFPKMISSNNKLHVVCTYPRPNMLTDTMFITKDISFDGNGDPVYEPLKGIMYWGIHATGINYIQGEQTRANIISTGSELYVVASLTYLDGEIKIDTKFKHKNISSEWDDSFTELVFDGKNFFKSPAIYYNSSLNKVGFTYSVYTNEIYLGIFREYDIDPGILRQPVVIIPPSTAIVGGWGAKNIQGEFVVLNSFASSGSGESSNLFYGIRRPDDISGNISYNTLLTGNEYFNAPTPPYCRTNGADVEALANSITRLKANTRIFIDDNDQIIFRPNSCLIFETNSEIFPDPGPVIYQTNCITWANLACNRTYPGGLIRFDNGLNYTVNNGAFIVIDGNSTLELTDNTNLIFDGSNSFLKLRPNSNIKMGSNSSIKFINGAFLNSNGASLTGINATSMSNGLVFENSGIDSIVNSTFANTKIAITIKDNPVSSIVNRIIKNNIFNIPAGGDYKGIYGENVNKITLEGNQFNMPVTSQGPTVMGVFLKNVNPSSEQTLGAGNSEDPIIEDGPDDAMVYILNIINNKFKGGTASLVLANYVSNYLPYYIKGNTFDSATSNVNLLGMQIGGTIKDNILSSLETPMGIHLVNSNPDLLNNTIASKNVALHLAGHSYPNLAPMFAGNQMSWRGGKNHLTSYQIDAVQLAGSGNVFTDYGNDRFLTSDNGYHIYGWVDTSVHTYYSRNNCWYRSGNTSPNIWLTRTGSTQPIPSIAYNYYYDCTHEPAPIEIQLDYVGHGIFDSTLVSDNDTGEEPGADQELYYQAYDNLREYLPNNAIINYKNLIDNFPNSDFEKDALYDLYTCYELLDTSHHNQDYVNTLYGNLNDYLNNKIESEVYSEGFNDIAFDITLMCSDKIEDYDNALNGYEFMSLFHPDPDIRLMASWNYSEIEAIINGGGGGEKGNIATVNSKKEFTEFLELVRIENVINNDPLLTKMKKVYEKIEKDRKANNEKQLREAGKNEYEIQNSIIRSNELDNLKKEKAKRNIFELRSLKEDELEKRRIEDLITTMKNVRNESSTDQNLNIPLEYKLLQNYPNPFNPSTIISYSIPVSGIVKIKIYDLTGREIKILVNETKEAGRYEARFDGSNLSSGVYFYKLESGNFVQSKKMLLLK